MSEQELKYGQRILVNYGENNNLEGVYIGWSDNSRTWKNHVVIVRGKKVVTSYRFSSWIRNKGRVIVLDAKPHPLTKLEKEFAEGILEKY